MGAKSRPTPYHKPSFHLIRLISFISSLIVSGIVGWFCYQLKHDGYKLPWTFLFILAASVFTLLTLILTTCIYACAFLSPLFNLILNVPLALIWSAGFSLLTWNTLGLLTHTCSHSNYPSSDSRMVCRSYKANYTFVITGLLSHIAMVIVDIRARTNQTALGRYAQMDDSAKALDVKRESDNDWSAKGVRDGDVDLSSAHANGARYRDEVPYGIDVDARRPMSGPGQKRETSPYGANANEGYNMQDFGYQAPVQQHTYDSGNYYAGQQHR